jgi:hypothetical protein
VVRPAPEVRKEIFLVTKDMPRTPSQMLKMVDQRLETLGTDYIDLFFIHGLGDDHSLDDAINLVKSQEFKETAEAIRKSGKAKFVGFSTHHKDRAQIIQAAAEGGIVDAIMLQYTPWLDKDAPLNKALDACWEKGIGLISMKQIAGKQFGDAPKGNILEDVVRRVPMLAEKKLTPVPGPPARDLDRRADQQLLRLDAQHRPDPRERRRRPPLRAPQGGGHPQLRDATLAQGPTLCADCDGRCSTAAGTTAELGNLTRFLTYMSTTAIAARPAASSPPSPRGPRLGRRRPRGRPRRLPQPARLRQADARGRSTSGLTRPREGLPTPDVASRGRTSTASPPELVPGALDMAPPRPLPVAVRA